jgi:hypothetical protein
VKASEKWKDLDKIINSKLKEKLQKKSVKQMDVSLHSLLLLEIIYDVLSENCEIHANDLPVFQSRSKRKNKKLEELRKRKNDLRKGWKLLCRQGLEKTESALILANEWKKTLRAHNYLRKSLLKKKEALAQKRLEKKFKKNPFAFADKVLNPEKGRADPRFSREEATEFYKATYQDEGRGMVYCALEDMPRPDLPFAAFSEKNPSFGEFKICLKRKKNKCSPGLDAVPYIVFKKCPAAARYLFFLICRVWDQKCVPTDWCQASVTLAKKGSLLENLDKVGEFRPIALTACVGKIFFGIIANRFQTYMIENKYIARVMQKGFVGGVPGCMEHTFTLNEALRDAYKEQKQIALVWVDLANAFGSVSHNLIQFALEWFHVPYSVRKLLLDYYKNLWQKLLQKIGPSLLFSFV